MLKKMLKGIFILLIGGFTQSAFAFSSGDTVCVSGAGTPAANGTYTYVNADNLINNSGLYNIQFYMITDMTRFQIEEVGNMANNYHTNDGYMNTVASLVGAAPWITNEDNVVPLPTVTSGSCVVAPAPTAVPLSPLSKLLLALLFMGGSLYMLKRRKEKA